MSKNANYHIKISLHFAEMSVIVIKDLTIKSLLNELSSLFTGKPLAWLLRLYHSRCHQRYA